MKKWFFLTVAFVLQASPNASAERFICASFPHETLVPEEISVSAEDPVRDVSIVEFDSFQVEIRIEGEALLVTAQAGQRKISEMRVIRWSPSTFFKIANARCVSGRSDAAEAYTALQVLRYYRPEIERQVSELETQNFKMAFGSTLNRPSGKVRDFKVKDKRWTRHRKIQADFYRTNEKGVVQRATLEVEFRIPAIPKTARSYRPPGPVIDDSSITIVDLPEHGGTNTSGGR